MEQKFKIVNIKKIEAPNFIMSPVELKDFIDFEVKRVYFISRPTGNTGSHCHKIEKEFFVMVNGACTAVIDSGYGLVEYIIKAPESALYIGNYVWHHFKDFSKDAILLALSSTNYNPDRSDYIDDYDKFKQTIEKSKENNLL